MTTTTAVDLRRASVSRAGGDGGGVIIRPEDGGRHFGQSMVLPEIPVSDLPSGVKEFEERLGEDFYEYNTYCARAPSGVADRGIIMPSRNGEPSTMVATAHNRLKAACPVDGMISVVMNREPAAP